MGIGRWPSCTAALALFVLAGCGGGVAPVSGLVTLDSQPLANASVTFQPVGDGSRADVGSGSYALTDESGRYALKMVSTDRPGAVTGKHVVRISLHEPAGDGDSDSGGREKLPARYNTQTTLSYEVPRTGTANADFALESGRNPPRP